MESPGIVGRLGARVQVGGGDENPDGARLEVGGGDGNPDRARVEMEVGGGDEKPDGARVEVGDGEEKEGGWEEVVELAAEEEGV